MRVHIYYYFYVHNTSRYFANGGEKRQHYLFERRQAVVVRQSQCVQHTYYNIRDLYSLCIHVVGYRLQEKRFIQINRAHYSVAYLL